MKNIALYYVLSCISVIIHLFPKIITFLRWETIYWLYLDSLTAPRVSDCNGRYSVKLELNWVTSSFTELAYVPSYKEQWIQETLAPATALPLKSCVIIVKLLHFSESLIAQMKTRDYKNASAQFISLCEDGIKSHVCFCLWLNYKLFKGRDNNCYFFASSM